MPLVVENGTGVENANSYVTVEQIVQHAKERGIVIAEADFPKAEAAAIRAMDYFFTQCLRGELAYPGEQWTLYPRRGLVEGDTAPDAVLSIPINVVKAQLHLSLDSYNGIELVPSRAAAPKLKKRKTGPIEREYYEASDYLPDLPMVDALLAPLKCGQAFRLRTYRA